MGSSIEVKRNRVVQIHCLRNLGHAFHSRNAPSLLEILQLPHEGFILYLQLLPQAALLLGLVSFPFQHRYLHFVAG